MTVKKEKGPSLDSFFLKGSLFVFSSNTSAVQGGDEREGTQAEEGEPRGQVGIGEGEDGERSDEEEKEEEEEADKDETRMCGEEKEEEEVDEEDGEIGSDGVVTSDDDEDTSRRGLVSLIVSGPRSRRPNTRYMS